MPKRPISRCCLQQEIYQKLIKLQDSKVKVLLYEEEAAEFLKLSVSALGNWRLRGTGPRYCKFGGAVRYDYADLVDYINASKTMSTSQADS